MRDPDAEPGKPPLLEGVDYAGLLQVDPTGLSMLPHVPSRDRLLLETQGDDALRIGHDFYPGRLFVELLRDDDGRPDRIELVLEVQLEDYVLGVVSGEMSASLPDAREALAAQAVAARTYALWRISRGRTVLQDDARDQVFRGSDYYTRVAREAVAETRGLVLAWDGALLPAYFHARCGGRTADAAAADFVKTPLPPLAGVADPQCSDPFDRWTRQVPTPRLDEFAQSNGVGDWLRGIYGQSADATGRLLEVRVVGATAHTDLPAEAVRAGFGLPSSQWTALRVNPDGSLTVEGTGRGHGVGLCQRGAMRLSQAGMGHVDILAHYFPGAALRPLATGPES
jgi:stage II sporulation protein D